MANQRLYISGNASKPSQALKNIGKNKGVFIAGSPRLSTPMGIRTIKKKNFIPRGAVNRSGKLGVSYSK